MNFYVSFFFISLFLSSFVFCWGNDGHMIVGQVATAYLTDNTQNQLSPMLGQYDLADIATWPDNYDHTSEGAWSEKLHFVNLQTTDVKFNYNACIPPAAVPYGCVIAAISNFTYILEQDLKNNIYEQCIDSDDVEPCPLSFLTHFLGDSHQPLHVAYEIDEGGNDFDCEYSGECTELHSVWDSRMIYTYEDDNDYDWYDVSQQIVSWLNENQDAINVFTNTTKPDAWGSESFAIARYAPYNLSPATVPAVSGWVHKIYDYIGNNSTSSFNNFHKERTPRSCEGPVLPYQYYVKNIPVVFDQLAKAGTRLAYLLNTIYDPSFTGVLRANN